MIDIEAIVKKYWCTNLLQRDFRNALTELAAEYEQKIAGLESEAILSRALSERIRQLEAERVPEGLSVQQEPKYTTNGSAIVNRASGEEIPPDEPVFIFRARDIHAREALEAYACVIKPGIHREKVCERIADFAKFARENKSRMKQPDTAQVLLAATPAKEGE